MKICLISSLQMLVAPDDTYILIVQQQNKELQKEAKTSEDEQDGVTTNTTYIITQDYIITVYVR